MIRSNRTLIAQYCVALLLFGAAVFATNILFPLIELSTTTLFFAAIMLAAFYGGLGPGLLVSIFSTFAIDYYFVPPYHAFELSPANTVRAGVFMLVSTMTSGLNASRKKLMEDVREKNREREELIAQISRFNEELKQEVEAATEDLSSANEALLQTQQRLIRSERLAVVGQMAASLAHEIGTPINSVSGHVELLGANYPEDEDTQRRVRIISRQLEFIVGAVKNLLEWTHDKRPVFRPVDLSLLIEEIISLVAPTLDKHEIDVEMDLERHLPLIDADGDGLQQVFLNLINNSVEAMPSGGRVEITAVFDRAEMAAQISFRDTGRGIAFADLDHIFEPMWTTKPTGGGGFGLAIAQQIVNEQGGRIEAVRRPGPGAEFRITLPLSGGATPASDGKVMANVS